MRVTERLTPVAAAVSAIATLACCLPLGIAGAVGALGLSVALASLRPWLIGVAVILLGISFWQLYRGQRTCRRSRVSLFLLGVSALVVLAVIVFPQKLAELMAALP
jgi:type VI protein secretion system component VasK